MNTLAMTKKAAGLAFSLVLLATGAGCGGGGGGPADTAQNFMRQVSEGNTEQAAAMVAGTEQAGNAQKKKAEAMIARQRQQMQKRGGLESVEVLEENAGEEQEGATVQLRMTFGNGESREESLRLVEKEDGWKIQIR